MGAWNWVLDRIDAVLKMITRRARPAPRSRSKVAPPEPIPTDPRDHAEQFAVAWYDRLESFARKRLRQLGIPDHQIGAQDRDFNLRLAAFHPRERTGGGVSPGGRINLNSGVLNPDLLVPHPSPTVSSIWRRARLRDRCDAVIAHEWHEGQGLSHAEAERRAAETELPVTPGARRILQAMIERER
jgi:hypothetical protein